MCRSSSKIHSKWTVRALKATILRAVMHSFTRTLASARTRTCASWLMRRIGISFAEKRCQHNGIRCSRWCAIRVVLCSSIIWPGSCCASRCVLAFRWAVLWPGIFVHCELQLIWFKLQTFQFNFQLSSVAPSHSMHHLLSTYLKRCCKCWYNFIHDLPWMAGFRFERCQYILHAQ